LQRGWAGVVLGGGGRGQACCGAGVAAAAGQASKWSELGAGRVLRRGVAAWSRSGRAGWLRGGVAAGSWGAASCLVRGDGRASGARWGLGGDREQGPGRGPAAAWASSCGGWRLAAGGGVDLLCGVWHEGELGCMESGGLAWVARCDGLLRCGARSRTWWRVAAGRPGGGSCAGGVALACRGGRPGDVQEAGVGTGARGRERTRGGGAKQGRWAAGEARRASCGASWAGWSWGVLERKKMALTCTRWAGPALAALGPAEVRL
jgi:hypothetical protein